MRRAPGIRSFRPSAAAGNGSRWMIPAAVVLTPHSASLRSSHLRSETNCRRNDTAVVSDLAVAGLNDADLLQEVSAQPAMMRAQYEDNLRRVNEYIQDAKSIVNANPNDEEARRSLMEAYQEKAMLFELAMDRSLP